MLRSHGSCNYEFLEQLILSILHERGAVILAPYWRLTQLALSLIHLAFVVCSANEQTNSRRFAEEFTHNAKESEKKSTLPERDLVAT